MSTRSHPIKATLALAAGLLAMPGAGALAARSRTASTKPSTRPAAQVIRVSPHSGFSWGDAGIGAGAGFGLAMLALGGGLMLAERRRITAKPPRAPAESRSASERRRAIDPPTTTEHRHL